MSAAVVVLLSLLLLLLCSVPPSDCRPHAVSSAHVSPAFTPPVPDASPTSSSPSVPKTVLQWERQLRTCDSAADADIDPLGGSTSRVIYAIGDADPTSDTTVHRHSTMGVRNLNLFASEPSPVMPSDARSMSIMTRPFPIDRDTLTAPSTYYHCQAFQRNLTDRAHLIKVTPQVDFYHSSLVHHMVLYQCGKGWTEAELAWSGDCFSDSSPTGIDDCDMQHVLAAWAVGGGEFHYPPEVGFPIGPGVTNMMLQIHYHNPRGVTFNDSAGFILTSTPTLRKFDAASLTVSHNLATLVLPPRRDSVNVSVYLPSNCTQGLPEEGLKVFAGMQHTHETGTALRLQHFRGEQELPLIDGNEHYDFAFQQMVGFSPDRYPVLRRGDALQLTCSYDTRDRSNVTVGGLATTDEMCIQFFWYYPARYAKAPLTVALGHGSQPSNSPMQYTTCVYADASHQTYHLPMASRPPLTSPPCTPAAAGNRTWGSSAATNGSIGTTPISAQQWLVERASYARSAVLDDAGQFVLYWNVSVDADGANGVIRFAAEVETTGWVGLGLSPTGAMVDSDSVIGWVRTVEEGAASTVVDLTDRWNAEYAQPRVDFSQDVYNVRGVQAQLPRTSTPVNPIYYNVTKQPPPSGPMGGSSDSGVSVVVVVGAVAGLAVLVMALIALVWWMRRSRASFDSVAAEPKVEAIHMGNSGTGSSTNNLKERLLV